MISKTKVSPFLSFSFPFLLKDKVCVTAGENRGPDSSPTSPSVTEAGAWPAEQDRSGGGAACRGVELPMAGEMRTKPRY